MVKWMHPWVITSVSSAKRVHGGEGRPGGRSLTSRVSLEVGNVDGHVIPTDESLQLRGGEEAEPAGGHNLTQPANDGPALAADLLVEPVIRHQVHILNSVVASHWDGTAAIA